MRWADADADPKEVARKRYEEVVKLNGELLVSGSEDFTCYLWDPSKSKTPITRLTGHQKGVNYVSYSPDGRTIARLLIYFFVCLFVLCFLLILSSRKQCVV